MRKPTRSAGGGRRIPAAVFLVGTCILLAGCSTIRTTVPQRSATEQLLISAAADRALEQLDFEIAPGTRVFVSGSSLESYDEPYVMGAVRDRVLREGGLLVDDRAQSEVVLEVRAGALSIDEESDLVGLLAFDIPIPLAPASRTPEIALYKREHQEGVAKLAVTSFRSDSGAHNGSSGPAFGRATHDRTVFLFFSWIENDPPKPWEKGTRSWSLGGGSAAGSPPGGDSARVPAAAVSGASDLVRRAASRRGG